MPLFLLSISPFQGNSMKQLVSNIINSPLSALPSVFSQESKALVKLMLAKNFKERPSINTILAASIFKEKIGMMLTDQFRKVSNFLPSSLVSTVL
jgi:serine/threonine protein kinase